MWTYVKFQKHTPEQECIPVGCILPAAVAVSWGGGLPQCMLGYPLGVGLEIPLGVGLETPQVWAWRPPGQTPQPKPWVWSWRPPWLDPSTSPWVWDLRPPRPDPSSSPWVWVWRPARHAGIPPPLETCKACLDITCKACWDTTPTPLWTEFLKHTSENITLSQLHCRR